MPVRIPRELPQRCGEAPPFAFAFRWEPPHLCGGGALQRSEKALDVTRRFSAGFFGGSPRIYAGEERFSAPKNRRLSRCALAPGIIPAAPRAAVARGSDDIRSESFSNDTMLD